MATVEKCHAAPRQASMMSLGTEEMRSVEELSASGRNSRCHSEWQRVRGLPPPRLELGRASDVPHLRKRRLLRLVAWQACDQAFPCDHASDHEVVREGHGLAMVLRRREIRLGGTPPPRN